MKQSLMMDIVDAIEELEGNPLARGERQSVVALGDVVAERLIAILHFVFVASLVILININDVRKAQSLQDLELLLEPVKIAFGYTLLRAFDRELDAVVGITKENTVAYDPSPTIFNWTADCRFFSLTVVSGLMKTGWNLMSRICSKSSGTVLP